jgi:hypothetical protein
VSGQLQTPSALLPSERAPDTLWAGDWVGPKVGLNDMEKWKFSTLSGIKLWLLGDPAHSHSLYQLRYHSSSAYVVIFNANEKIEYHTTKGYLTIIGIHFHFADMIFKLFFFIKISHLNYKGGLMIDMLIYSCPLVCTAAVNCIILAFGNKVQDWRFSSAS